MKSLINHPQARHSTTGGEQSVKQATQESISILERLQPELHTTHGRALMYHSQCTSDDHHTPSQGTPHLDRSRGTPTTVNRHTHIVDTVMTSTNGVMTACSQVKRPTWHHWRCLVPCMQQPDRISWNRINCWQLHDIIQPRALLLAILIMKANDRPHHDGSFPQSALPCLLQGLE